MKNIGMQCGLVLGCLLVGTLPSSADGNARGFQSGMPIYQTIRPNGGVVGYTHKDLTGRSPHVGSFLNGERIVRDFAPHPTTPTQRDAPESRVRWRPRGTYVVR